METIYTVKGKEIISKYFTLLVSAKNAEEAAATARIMDLKGYTCNYISSRFNVESVVDGEERIKKLRKAVDKINSEEKKKMTAIEYQKGVQLTRNKFCSEEDEMKNYCLGMSSEVGELIGAIKHHLFHKWELDLPNIVEEMGDIIWYVTALASTLGIDLNEVLDYNLLKLKERYPDGFDPQKSINRKENKTDDAEV